LKVDANPEAKKILKDGALLETTEALALQVSNDYDFARRIIEEISLIYSGQIIKRLNIGQPDRAYSHAGFYAPPGLGKDFGWKIAASSGILPTDTFRLTKLENVTEAALSGSINELTLVLPPTVTEDVIFVGEYATLNRRSSAAAITADMRAILESGQYSRRLVKIGRLKEELQTNPDSSQAKYVKRQLVDYEKYGMHIDLNKCEISVKSTTSWVVASARFGAESQYGRSLLSMGDINRYRWRSYLPEREERLKITSLIGSLPPITVDAGAKIACREAWATLISSMRKSDVNGLVVPRDEQSFHERQRIWDETQELVMDTFQNEMHDEVYFSQLFNMRTRAEFTRVMYQHAALKQYARNTGGDFCLPEKFVIDYNEDGEFAKQYWLSEYVPSMIDVINDVLRTTSITKKSQRETLTSRIIEIVTDRLANGRAKREELVELLKAKGIKYYLLDSKVLPLLIEREIIIRDSFGYYSLAEKSQEKLIGLWDSMRNSARFTID
jgi:hypothetical protein